MRGFSSAALRVSMSAYATPSKPTAAGNGCVAAATASAGGHKGTRPPVSRTWTGYAGAHQAALERAALTASPKAMGLRADGEHCHPAKQGNPEPVKQEEAKAIVEQLLALRLGARQDPSEFNPWECPAAAALLSEATAAAAERLSSRKVKPASSTPTSCAGQPGAALASSQPGVRRAMRAGAQSSHRNQESRAGSISTVRTQTRADFARRLSTMGGSRASIRSIHSQQQTAHETALEEATDQLEMKEAEMEAMLAIFSEELVAADFAAKTKEIELARYASALEAAGKEDVKTRSTIGMQARQLDASLREERSLRDELRQSHADRAELEKIIIEAQGQMAALVRQASEAADADELKRECERLRAALRDNEGQRAAVLRHVTELQHELMLARRQAEEEGAAKNKLLQVHKLTKLQLARERASCAQTTAATEEQVRRQQVELRQRLDALRVKNNTLEARARAAAAAKEEGEATVSHTEAAVAMLADEHVAALKELDDARDALDDAALTERRLTAQLLSLQQELDAAEARSREDHACFDILRREISADDSWLMPMLGKQVHEVAAVQASFSALQRHEAHAAQHSERLQQQVESLLARLQAADVEAQAESAKLKQKLLVAGRQYRELKERFEQEAAARADAEQLLLGTRQTTRGRRNAWAAPAPSASRSAAAAANPFGAAARPSYGHKGLAAGAKRTGSLRERELSAHDLDATRSPGSPRSPYGRVNGRSGEDEPLSPRAFTPMPISPSFSPR